MNNNQLTTTLQLDWNLLFGSMIMFVLIVGMIRMVSRDLLTDHSNPATGYHSTKKLTGTCYEEAWRFLIKEEEGELIHGSVESEGRRLNHAWVELPTGYVFEPQTGDYFKLADFNSLFNPQRHARYTSTEAAIIAARTSNLGPWSEEERGMLTSNPSQSIHTLTLPPETKAAMLSLCEKARGKKVEYGMVMLIRDSEIRAGPTKWGARELMRIEVTEPLGGIFHIHTDTLRPSFSWEELHGKKIAKSVRWETVESEPQLSDFDKLRLLVDDKLIFMGVGTPHRNYIKVVTKIKEVEPQFKEKLIEISPLVAGFGAPIEGIEEYYHEYTIRLDDGAPSYIDVLI